MYVEHHHEIYDTIPSYIEERFTNMFDDSLHSFKSLWLCPPEKIEKTSPKKYLGLSSIMIIS